MDAGLIALAVGLGLLGFIEPCTMGVHLGYLARISGARAMQRAASLALFATMRALTAGMFGVAAAALGERILGWQNLAWGVLGLALMTVGGMYLFRGSAPSLPLFGGIAKALRHRGGTLMLGLAGGLAIPACAAPLLLVLSGISGAAGASARLDMGDGFVLMAIFGLSLSLPLIPLSWFPVLAGRLEILSVRLAQGGRLRRVLGGVFALLGVWSLYFAVAVDIRDWGLS